MNDKLAKLRGVLEAIDRDVPSTQEVADIIATVIKAVQEARIQLEQQAEDNRGELTGLVDDSVKRLDRGLRSLESSLEGKIQLIKKNAEDKSKVEVDRLAGEIYRELRELKDSIPDATDLAEVFQKIDESEAKITEKIVKDLPKFGEAFRDGLEDLQDDERVDKKAVKGIDEIEKEIAALKARPSGSSGGGVKPIAVQEAGTTKSKNVRFLNFVGASVSESATGVTTVTVADATGDINGPASTTPNAIVRTSGTGGYTVQGYTSGAPTISDTGAMALAVGANSAGNLALHFIGDTDTGIYRAGANEIQLVAGGGEILGATTIGAKLGTAGSAAQPAIYKNGDLNTGLYWGAADEFGISTGGVVRVFAGSTGNVGVGTASPNVGTAAGTHLTVSGTVATPAIEIYGNFTGIANTPHAEIKFWGQNTSSAVSEKARIDVRAGTSGTTGGQMVFHTKDVTNPFTLTERMRINDSGFVGIGNTNPGARLHIGPSVVSTISGKIGGVSDSVVSHTSSTSGDTIAYQLFVNDGTRGSRVELFMTDAASEGGAWGLSQTFSSGGQQPFVIDNAGAERFRITATGLVGIGTTGPGAMLDVVGANTTDKINLSTYTTGATGANMRFKHARGTVAVPTTVADADDLGQLVFQGHDGTSFLNGAQIISRVDAAVSTGVMPGNIMFLTSQGNTRMTITSGGNVGIGTGASAPSSSFNRTLNINDTASGGNAALTLSQPTKKFSLAVVGTTLRVYDETGGAYRLTIDTTGKIGVKTITPQFEGISFGEIGSYMAWQYGANAASRNWGITTDLDAFGGLSVLTSSAKTDGLLDTTRLFISSTGNVGIGTTDPLTKLHVAGAITATGSANNRVTNNKILYGATTDAATAVELTTDGAAGSGATNRLAVAANTAMSVVVNIVVKQTGSANSKQMLRQFLIVNNAGVTSIQGSVTTLGTDVGSAGLTTVTTTITANDTDDCIKVEVNGIALTNLRYTCYCVSTEVIYA